MAEILNLQLLAAGLRLSAPILLAALGGLFTERVGIFNIALEAMMLVGAFAGVVSSYWAASAWIGVLGAVLAGLLVAIIFALFTLKLESDPIMTGIALNLIIGGLTVLLMQVIFGVRGMFHSAKIGLLPQINYSSPLLTRLLGGNNIIFYLAFILVPILYILFYHTRLGLRIRAIGKYAPAVEVVGVNPRRYQLFSILASGVLSGLAGAWLSLSSLGMFTENMTAGRGFIALSAIFFGRSTPVGILLASVFFGLAEAIAIRLQGLGMPSQLVLMIPYVATVVSLAFAARSWEGSSA
ncbi:MAG: ABC transporter permease [Firmicutes bacterium]|nr:ABC transporter permease [Bacillota bacterium]